MLETLKVRHQSLTGFRTGVGLIGGREGWTQPPNRRKTLLLQVVLPSLLNNPECSFCKNWLKPKDKRFILI